MARITRNSLAASLALALAVGACTEPQTEGALRLRWSAPLAETGGSSWLGQPGISGSTAIVADGSALRAYDITSGAVLWTTRLRAGVPLNATNVAISAGRAYVATGDSVFAVGIADGRRLWAFLPDAQAAACEVAADAQAVYVGTRSHRVYRLDASSGTPVWSIDVGPAWSFLGIVTGIALAGDTAYASVTRYLNASGGFRTGSVIALDAATGAELWRYEGSQSPDDANDATGAPRVFEDLLLVAHHYHNGQGGSFFALDRMTGTLRWRVRVPGLGPLWAPW